MMQRNETEQSYGMKVDGQKGSKGTVQRLKVGGPERLCRREVYSCEIIFTLIESLNRVNLPLSQISQSPTVFNVSPDRCYNSVEVTVFSRRVTDFGPLGIKNR